MVHLLSVRFNRFITALHRRRKVLNIGRQGLEYWGPTGGPTF